MKQTTQISQRQVSMPQLIQAGQLYLAPNHQLSTIMNQYLEINPALEESEEYEFGENQEEPNELENDPNELLDYPSELINDEFDGKNMHADGYNAEEEFEQPLASTQTFQDYIQDQLKFCGLTPTQLEIGQAITNSLDDNGFFTIPFDEFIKEDLGKALGIETTVEELKNVLQVVQQLDPPGIGATNVREYIRLRLNHEAPSPECTMSQKIVTYAFEEYVKGDYKRVATIVGVRTDDDVELLQRAIVKLKGMDTPTVPTGDTIQHNRTKEHIPDFSIKYSEEGKELDAAYLEPDNIKSVDISRSYSRIVEENKFKRSDDQVVKFVREKVIEAKTILGALREMRTKKSKFIKLIAKEQRAYFMSGNPVDIKPLSMTLLSEKTGISLSTVSQLCSSKHIDTDFGVISLRSVFERGIDQNAQVTVSAVKGKIADFIKGERKERPFTDFELTRKLNHELGLDITVKKVTNLRSKMKIKSSDKRLDIREEIKEGASNRVKHFKNQSRFTQDLPTEDRDKPITLKFDKDR